MAKKKTDRMTELLELCARNLEKCCDPFSGDFLEKHDVTADECYAMAQQMAVAIKAYIRTPHDERLMLATRACADDHDIRESMVTFMKHRNATNAVVSELGKLQQK